jgi:hypothetical protein
MCLNIISGKSILYLYKLIKLEWGHDIAITIRNRKFKKIVVLGRIWK